MQSYRQDTASGKALSLLHRATAMEIANWRSMYRWLRRKPVATAPGDQVFSYLGVVKPIFGVFIGLSAVEVPIFDVIIRHVVPWAPARWIALGLGVWGLLWMIGLYASLKIHPHVVGPAGLRRDIADQLAAQIGKLLADPATRDKLTALALEPLPGSTPDSFAAYVKTEVDRWAVIVRNSGAALE